MFDIFNIFKKSQKTPIIKDNTIIVWEACSLSHSEVVPGFVKYFHDLGYHVSVLVDPDRLKEGLFERFNLENVTLNKNCETTILRDERITRVWGREGIFTLGSGVIKELYD